MKWEKGTQIEDNSQIILYGSFFISIMSMIISFKVSTPTVFAQLLNDRDSDGIEDETDPCPDDPDTSCATFETPAQDPGFNTSLDQVQVQDIPGGELPPQPVDDGQMASLVEICDNTIDDDGDTLIDSNMELVVKATFTYFS